MPTIRPLPATVAAQIQSSVSITSLNEVVLGLVVNSLDAGCTSLHIDVDFAKSSCIISDNGVGIPAAELTPHGNLAKAFHTSKVDPEPTECFHGHRGLFLASLGAVSILGILSKQQGDERPSKLVLFQGERVNRQDGRTLVNDQLRYRRHGTTATVQNLFGDMPVRVKQRPVGDEGKRARDRSFRALVRVLSGVVISWPRCVDITMSGADQGQKWRIRQADELCRSDQPTEQGMADFNAARICNVLTQVIDVRQKWSSWVQTSARGSAIRARGLISKLPAPTKNSQFISLGAYPIYRQEPYSKIYDVIDQAIASSDFAGEVASRTESIHVNPAALTGDPKNGGSGLKPQDTRDVDKYAMYYIRVDVLTPVGVAAMRPSELKEQELKNISLMLEAMVNGFLENQNIHTRRKRRRKGISKTSSPASSEIRLPERTRTTSNAFNEWSRIKNGTAIRKPSKDSESQIAEHGSPDQEHEPRNRTLSPSPAFDTEVSSFDEEYATQLCQEAEAVAISSNDRLIRWTDPKTGEVFRINERTGMAQACRKPAQSEADASPHFSCSSRKRVTLPVKPVNSLSQDDPAIQWAQKVTESWQNPVFKDRERPIPSVVPCDTDIDILLGRQASDGNSNKRMERLFANRGKAYESRITQSQLKEAEMIAQVDTKFILAKVPGLSDGEARDDIGINQLLILVDQHAADERIRVEELFAELCAFHSSLAKPSANESDHLHETSIRPVYLEEPLVFELTTQDQNLLSSDNEFFQGWGISYTVRKARVVSESAGATSRQRDPVASGEVIVQSLPPLIAERCRLNPELLRNLLLKEARRRDELGLNGKLRTVPNVSSGEASWLQQIHDCPQGILDMLNSRACRSAIMFNDALSMEQCRELVQKLAETALPFQCAHGRPSLVPLGGLTEFIESRVDETDDSSFADAWEKWTNED